MINKDIIRIIKSFMKVIVKLLISAFAVLVVSVTLLCALCSYGLRHGYLIISYPHSYTEMKASEYFESKTVLDTCTAISDNNMDKLKLLLNDISDVNIKGKQNATILLWALYKENYEAFKLLLENGADPNIQISNNITYARDKYRHAKVYLAGDSVTSLAASLYKPEYLQIVLQYKGDPNLINPFTKVTPLYDIATRSLFAETDDEVTNFRALIKAGADLEYRIPGQINLLFYTIKRGQPRFILTLLESGGDYYTLNNDGSDCMMLLHNKLVKDHRYKELKSWMEKEGFDLEVAQKADGTWTTPVKLSIEERPWLPQKRNHQ